MSESVPVRCPACRRERLYTAPSYPCVCGTAVAPRLDPRATPAAVAHRAWDEEWITVPCPACGRHTQWPRPELGCPCGTVLHIPVTDPPPSRERTGHTGREPTATPAPTATPTPTASPAPTAAPAPRRPAEPPATGQGPAEPETGPAREATEPEDPPPAKKEAGRGPVTPREPTPGQHSAPATPDVAAARRESAPRGDTPRRAFHPVAIRTARDAVTAAALYLRWLGYRDIRRAGQRPTSGIGLAAHGLLAHVDPSVHPVSLRDLECLWLTAMADSTDCVYFSLAGYAPDARARAESLHVPLFVLDFTGTPQPVNAVAEELDTRGV
ncbi:hypothetical protein [Streptomyces sp. NPDC052015]|uniref:hypothetical protein n=1 Tax=Streptomyces sp. NPDC052015 TaxID=3154755 RepID=UPI0034326044